MNIKEHKKLVRSSFNHGQYYSMGKAFPLSTLDMRLVGLEAGLNFSNIINRNFVSNKLY
jgi:hypothetical protein